MTATLEQLEAAYREGWVDGYGARSEGRSDSEKNTSDDWQSSNTLVNAVTEGK